VTTGYRISDGTDLASLFTSSPGDRSPIGYKRSDGYDLNTLFHPYTIGAKRAATGYRTSAGVDFADLWQNSSVPLFTWTAVNEYVEDAGIYDPPYTNVGGVAGIQYKTDGTTLQTRSIGGNSAGTNWATGGGFTDKYVRLRSYTGDTPNSTSSAWVQLNANRSWWLQAVTATYKACTLTIDFSNDGVNIAHTVTVDLVCTVV
jgi:hypothetical protein